MSYNVLISGGGTGGHIFPALSIANALREADPDVNILFVGADNRMEMERVPAAGYDIVGLPVAGFDRKKLWRNIPVLWKLGKSLIKAYNIVGDFRPDIAIGVGGYASGPILREAQRRGIPTLIQEQNSYPGVTNKLLAAKADAICVAYEGLDRFFPADKIILTGNPVRAALEQCALTREEAKDKLGFSKDKPLVFVTGGSLGARTINEATAKSLPALERDGIQLLWQTGRYGADEFQAMASGRHGVKALTFVDDMAVAYRAADLVVARAGAGTISELQNLGIPAVLVPSPNVAEDHQRHNAESLASRGAAVMVLDRDAAEKLPVLIPELIRDENRRQEMSRNASAMALRDSAARIVSIVNDILSKNH
ncbi:MAG: undecaprenyldiphospho-muramoylpentapeptide beta-N-acetylglucosaminyltransferase [Lachnoclostridium sp.]|nr:undecaprenyldiphospho-muramoylpentapeptide beta-N-acetylglucosaminyltransferase [Lachnoclostridium sp.]